MINSHELDGNVITNLFPQDIEQTEENIKDPEEKIYERIFQLKLTLKGCTPPIWRRILVPENITFELLHLIIQSMCNWSNNYLYQFKVDDTYIRLATEELLNDETDDTIDNVTVLGTALSDDESNDAYLDEEEIGEWDDEDEEYDYDEDEECNSEWHEQYPPLEAEWDDEKNNASNVRISILEAGDKCVYQYKLSNMWEINIVLEKILEQDEKHDYPLCIKGIRNFPPEDLPGAYGYKILLEVISDPKGLDINEILNLIADASNLEFEPEYFDIDETNEGLLDVRDNYSNMYWLPPTMKAWEKLYQLAEKVQELSPWTKLWDNDIIVVEIEGRKEPAYIAIAGHSDKSYGFTIYPDNDSYLRVLRMRQRPKSEPSFLSICFQKCIMCYYNAGIEELTDEDSFVQKRIGLPNNQNNGTMLFRSAKPGLYPWYLDAQQVQLSTVVLENFIEAYNDLENGTLTVNFEAGETIYCSYCKSKKIGIRRKALFPIIEEKFLKLIIDDELFLERMKHFHQSDSDLSIDLVHVPCPVQEAKIEIPFLPKLWLIVDSISGELQSQHLFERGEVAEDVLFLMLREDFELYGKPSVIRVRDKLMAGYLKDFCGKTGIELVSEVEIPMIDHFVEALSQMPF